MSTNRTAKLPPTPEEYERAMLDILTGLEDLRARVRAMLKLPVSGYGPARDPESAREDPRQCWEWFRADCPVLDWHLQLFYERLETALPHHAWLLRQAADGQAWAKELLDQAQRRGQVPAQPTAG